MQNNLSVSNKQEKNPSFFSRAGCEAREARAGPSPMSLTIVVLTHQPEMILSSPRDTNTWIHTHTDTTHYCASASRQNPMQTGEVTYTCACIQCTHSQTWMVTHRNIVTQATPFRTHSWRHTNSKTVKTSKFCEQNRPIQNRGETIGVFTLEHFPCMGQPQGEMI